MKEINVSLNTSLNEDWYMRPVTAFDAECEDLAEQGISADQVPLYSRMTRDINLIKRAFPTMPERFQQALFDGKLHISKYRTGTIGSSNYYFGEQTLDDIGY